MKKKYKMISVLLSIVLMISLTSSTAFAKKIKPAPAIDLVVSAVFNDVNVDGYAGVGDTITYTFVVSNIGNVELTGVEVTGDLAVIWSDPIVTTLAVAATDTGSATYTLTAEDLVDETFVYNATATGTGGLTDVSKTASVVTQLDLLDSQQFLLLSLENLSM